MEDDLEQFREAHARAVAQVDDAIDSLDRLVLSGSYQRALDGAERLRDALDEWPGREVRLRELERHVHGILTDAEAGAQKRLDGYERSLRALGRHPLTHRPPRGPRRGCARHARRRARVRLGESADRRHA